MEGVLGSECLKPRAWGIPNILPPPAWYLDHRNTQNIVEMVKASSLEVRPVVGSPAPGNLQKAKLFHICPLRWDLGLLLDPGEGREKSD